MRVCLSCGMGQVPKRRDYHVLRTCFEEKHHPKRKVVIQIAR